MLFQSTYALASASCWKKTQLPQKTATTFILAMGANTGKLEKTNSDAQALANALQKRFNVPISNICVLKNVKRYEFNNALENLQKLVRKSDKVFLYFSGHGDQVKDKNYDEDDNRQTSCYDEALVIFHDIFKEADSISDDLFVGQVNKISDKGAIVTTILDSCFSGGMLRGTKNYLDMKSKLWFTDNEADTPEKKDCPSSNIKKLKGTVYMASKENQQSWEYPNGGIFTTTLVDNMRKYPYGELNEIFDITAEQVSRETKQRGEGKWQEPQRKP
ncbi:conserved hypothetical protein [Beggiatoa sp. PS]|nr:conserved hypothetical protein [Beggiatoa sp. PS]